jgi:hypothetical protein
MKVTSPDKIGHRAFEFVYPILSIPVSFVIYCVIMLVTLVMNNTINSHKPVILG